MNVHSEINAPSWNALDANGKTHAIIAAYDHAHNTASTIAAKLSRQFGCDISRHSVIGVYTRDRAKSWLLKTVPLKGTSTLFRKRHQKASAKPEEVARVEIPWMRNAGAPEPRLKTLMEMRDRECRWPVEGDKALTRFCCHETVDLRSYCEFHHKLSRGNGTASERAAHRALMALKD